MQVQVTDLLRKEQSLISYEIVIIFETLAGMQNSVFLNLLAIKEILGYSNMQTTMQYPHLIAACIKMK